MKTLTVIIIVAIVASLIGTFIWWAVTEYDKELAIKVTQLEEMLGGEREVRRMHNTKDRASTFNSSFFLFAGSARGQSSEDFYVIFSWKLNDGSYITTKMPIERVRMKFGNYDQPKIQFKLSHPTSDFLIYENDIPYMISRYVYYVVVLCKEENWPSYYEMPLDNLIKEEK